MFNKTRSGLYRSLMLLAMIFVIAMVVPSIAIFSSTLYDTFETLAIRKIDRSIAASRSFINSVMTSTDNLASNATIQEVLSQDNATDTLTEILDNACNYSIKINAITIYSASGKIYSSSGVSGIPTLAELGDNDSIAEFFSDSNAMEYICMRRDCLIKIYDNEPYDTEQGIVSCCRKVYDGQGNTLGYIFSDLFPSAVFEYFDYSNDSYFVNSTAIVRYDGGYLSSDPSSAYNAVLYDSDAEISITAAADRIIVPSSRNFYGGTVCVAVPLRQFYIIVLILSMIFMGLGAGMLVVVHIISRKNAFTITGKLDALYEKMDTEIKF